MVRPVDFQPSIWRLDETAAVQRGQDSANPLRQQQQSQDIAQNSRQEAEQVRPGDEAASEQKIKDKKEREQRERRGKKPRQTSSPKEKIADKEQIDVKQPKKRKGHIDIIT